MNSDGIVDVTLISPNLLYLAVSPVSIVLSNLNSIASWNTVHVKRFILLYYIIFSWILS